MLKSGGRGGGEKDDDRMGGNTILTRPSRKLNRRENKRNVLNGGPKFLAIMPKWKMCLSLQFLEYYDQMESILVSLGKLVCF